jgi:hypothetical protein
MYHLLLYVLRIGQEESGGIRVRKAAGSSSRAGAQSIVVLSDGRHFQPPLQRTNYNVLRTFLLAEY